MKYIALTSLILPAKHAMEFKVSWVMFFPNFFLQRLKLLVFIGARVEGPG